VRSPAPPTASRRARAPLLDVATLVHRAPRFPHAGSAATIGAARIANINLRQGLIRGNCGYWRAKNRH
jgi:hypothetical protein